MSETMVRDVMVKPLMNGPDYSGTIQVDIEGCSYADVKAWGGNDGADVGCIIDVVGARQLFGKLGEALKLIDANSDPSAIESPPLPPPPRPSPERRPVITVDGKSVSLGFGAHLTGADVLTLADLSPRTHMLKRRVRHKLAEDTWEPVPPNAQIKDLDGAQFVTVRISTGGA